MGRRGRVRVTVVVAAGACAWPCFFVSNVSLFYRLVVRHKVVGLVSSSSFEVILVVRCQEEKKKKRPLQPRKQCGQAKSGEAKKSVSKAKSLSFRRREHNPKHQKQSQQIEQEAGRRGRCCRCSRRQKPSRGPPAQTATPASPPHCCSPWAPLPHSEIIFAKSRTTCVGIWSQSSDFVDE
jgi:hypothetical protein